MDKEELKPREAFESQVYNALSASMEATNALWEIYRSLQTENHGGSVSWDDIEENVWIASETAGFAQTYTNDETGVVEQWRNLEDTAFTGPSQVDDVLKDMPPMVLLKQVQKLANDPDASMEACDVATAASNVADREMILEIANCREDISDDPPTDYGGKRK